jgi:hypothetical protein
MHVTFEQKKKKKNKEIPIVIFRFSIPYFQYPESYHHTWPIFRTFAPVTTCSIVSRLVRG